MDKSQKAYLQIHIAVVLFGLTAIFGALIDLSATAIVWWRVLITSVSLLFLFNFIQFINSIRRSDLFRFIGIGFLVGLHWVCFYGSIKLANASIALICMATTTLFTSIIEPLILNKRFLVSDILVGILIILGMFFIMEDVSDDFNIGFYVGILSAFLASFFAVLNKKYIDRAGDKEITFIEMSAAFILLSIVLIYYKCTDQELAIMPETNLEWLWIILLSLGCTTLAYVLALKALNYISAFESNLIINLEPVYGIAMAYFLLNEHRDLTTAFYLGCIGILSIVIVYPWLKNKYLVEEKPN